MTKEEIVKAIWNQSADLTLRKAKLVYENTMNLIKDELTKGRSVEIRGFGKFSVRKKSQRIGRNPRNGEESVIKERRVVTFRPSKIFREQILNGREASE